VRIGKNCCLESDTLHSDTREEFILPLINRKQKGERGKGKRKRKKIKAETTKQQLMSMKKRKGNHGGGEGGITKRAGVARPVRFSKVPSPGGRNRSRFERQQGKK